MRSFILTSMKFDVLGNTQEHVLVVGRADALRKHYAPARPISASRQAARTRRLKAAAGLAATGAPVHAEPLGSGMPERRQAGNPAGAGPCCSVGIF